MKICLSIFLLLFASGGAYAQQDEITRAIEAFGTPVTDRMVYVIILLTLLSIAPGLLIMATSFTRITVVLSLLRTGLGLQSTPANMVMISLSLFITLFIMAPVFDKAYSEGVQPLIDKKISEKEAIAAVSQPFREFMLSQVREKDLRLFQQLSGREGRAELDANDLRVIVPAFMISELRRGFEIGFLIIIPFLIIDIAVATIVMSMGMMMMPPSVISLPIKIMFFVLIDGWNMLVGTLVRSFSTG
jgi:flagellar biosynthetic protein FliP